MNEQACWTETDRTKIARRMFCTIILVSFAPLVLVAGVVVEKFQTAYRASVHAHLRAIVDKHAILIDAFLNERQNDLSFLAGTVDGGSLNNSDDLKRCLKLLQKTHGSVFEDLSVIDETGRQTAYAGPFDLLNAGYADADWFKKAIRQPVFISDVFTGYRGYPHFVVTVALDTPNAVCLLRATIRFETFTSLIEHLKIGKTGAAFIINAAGTFQTQPDSPVFAAQTTYTDFFQRIQLAGPNASPEDTIHHLFNDALCVTEPVKGGEWLLVFLQDPSDAYDELIRAKKAAVVIFLLGAVSIIIMAFYLPARLLLGDTGKGANDPA